ncbi:MAG: hypothetical protein WBA57_27140 [Elainellaceae cyanobacterium]
MTLANRSEPQVGELWMDANGHKIEIVEVTADAETQKKYVVYRDAKNDHQISRLPMNDFMATLGEGDNTLMCCFQKLESH